MTATEQATVLWENSVILSNVSERKYRDYDWLYSEYYEKERPITELAEELDVDHTTISKWRRKLGVPKPTATVELECPVCGDDFEEYQSRVDRTEHANVCSRECHYEGRRQGIIGRNVGEDGYDVEPTHLDRECKNCGVEFVTTPAEDNLHCSRDCFLELHSERMNGEGNPAWVDGSSRDKRCWRGEDWDEIRLKVYERDEYTCQRCGVDCISRRDYNGENGDRIIQAHHIDPYESPEDNNLDNLVTLCSSCHTEVEKGGSL